MTSGLVTGIKTDNWLDRQPAALNVAWLEWDSAFREQGLRPGDQILQVQGRPLASFGIAADQLPGQAQESQLWPLLGLNEGSLLRLTVRRRRAMQGWDVLEFAAALRPVAISCNAEGRTLMGEGGPLRLSRDGFAEAWAPWLERRRFEWERQLDGTVWSGSVDTRQALARHLESEPRLRYLAKYYPGRFSDALVADWEALREVLAGRAYTLTTEDVRYREAESDLLRQVSAQARAAWDALAAELAPLLIEPPGPVTMAGDGLDALAGKVLCLPSISPQEWISDVGQVQLAWRLQGGWVVTALEQPLLRTAWQAQSRFRRDLSPFLSDDVALVARILPQPRLIAPQGAPAVVALEVEPLAVLMGAGEALMFVDLRRTDASGLCPFAGEAGVQPQPEPLPPDDASPAEVMQALIRALQRRDIATWRALFADWRLMFEDGQPYYLPYDPYTDANLQAHWEQSRRLVLGPVHAVRVAWVDDPREVVADEIPDMPRIERVVLELDHVGSFDGDYRSFGSPAVHRHWVLHRRDGGPWRISTHQGI